MDYIDQLADAETHGGEQRAGACFLCEAAQITPGNPQWRSRLILHNDEQGLILLNRYPYTNGHLLVAPHDHLGDLTDLTEKQRNDLMTLTVLAQRILQLAVNPQGVNIGLNIGQCAGAGLPGHVHVHVLPRWRGDTNFMQTVGKVRVIPQALEASYATLAKAHAQLNDQHA